MSDTKKILEKINRIEIMLIKLQKTLDLIVPETKEIKNDLIKINFVKNKDTDVVFFERYDKEKIKTYFKASSVFELFTKGNDILWAGYYRDGITNTCNLVLADNKKLLEELT